MSTLGREAGISKPTRVKPSAIASRFLADMKADSGSSIGSKIANTCLTFSDLSDLEPDNSNSEYSYVSECQLPEVDLKWMVEKTTKTIFQPPAPVLQPPLPEPSLSRTLRRILVTNLIFHYYLTDGQFKN
jgi:hypothetical protein